MKTEEYLKKLLKQDNIAVLPSVMSLCSRRPLPPHRAAVLHNAVTCFNDIVHTTLYQDRMAEGWALSESEGEEVRNEFEDELRRYTAHLNDTTDPSRIVGIYMDEENGGKDGSGVFAFPTMRAFSEFKGWEYPEETYEYHVASTVMEDSLREFIRHMAENPSEVNGHINLILGNVLKLKSIYGQMGQHGVSLVIPGGIRFLVIGDMYGLTTDEIMDSNRIGSSYRPLILANAQDLHPSAKGAPSLPDREGMELFRGKKMFPAMYMWMKPLYMLSSPVIDFLKGRMAEGDPIDSIGYDKDTDTFIPGHFADGVTSWKELAQRDLKWKDVEAHVGRQGGARMATQHMRVALLFRWLVSNEMEEVNVMAGPKRVVKGRFVEASERDYKLITRALRKRYMVQAAEVKGFVRRQRVGTRDNWEYKMVEVRGFHRRAHVKGGR